jgi:hypothetical protein
MAPIVHGLENEYQGKINFIYLDIDDVENNPYKRELGYRIQPHFFLLDEEGKVLQQWLGRVPQEELRSAFNQVLAK